MNSFTFGLAGTTKKTLTCAQSLLASQNFTCQWVLTPQPRPVGRKQVLEQNPVHQWAEQESIPHQLIDRKINSPIQSWVKLQTSVDFVVVVDFGYLVPQWLLDIPKIAPINVHPSQLPRWRGSSPGQFALLYGDEKSAVTIMIMNQELDQGPILWQESFPVQSKWTQSEYYQHSLQLAARALPTVLAELAQAKIEPQVQPLDSPTPTAKQLNKSDAFVSWQLLQQVQQATKNSAGSLFIAGTTSQLLQTVQVETKINWPTLLERATRAFSPWPILWTLIPTAKGEKRMKILSCSTQAGRLILEKVQLEGQKPTQWNQVKNIATRI